jgi:hypothetical protein
MVIAKMEMMVGDVSCRRCRCLAAALTSAMDGRPRRETASLVIVLIFEMRSHGTCTAAQQVRLAGHPGMDEKMMRTRCLAQRSNTFNCKERGQGLGFRLFDAREQHLQLLREGSGFRV